LITDHAGLLRFLDTTRDTSRLALDTEADSLHCYHEKLCLIQIATPEFSELLDPLADVPLQDFIRAANDKHVVFHGADYDLRLLNRHGDFAPVRLFDTMLAARLVGESHVGLAALVKKYFDVELCKASQKANWAQRPLSSQMLDYALSDVQYLLELEDILTARLIELGRMQWLEESVARLQETCRNVKEKDPEKQWRITGMAKLEPLAQAVGRALWFWRDTEASNWDRPPFYVLSNSDILRIAEAAVDGRPFSTPRFPRNRRERFEKELEQALALPESDWPVTEKRRRPKPDPNFSKRFDQMKAKRDRVAGELDLEPALIAPKAALESYAANGDTALLMNWQRRLLGLSVPGSALLPDS
jgi:ribonuclease D